MTFPSRWVALTLSLLLAGCPLPPPDGKDGAASTLATPMLRKLPETTTSPVVEVVGYTQPGLFIDLYVNGVQAATTTASTTGEFVVRDVSLTAGRNVIRAVAYDGKGNRSPEIHVGSIERGGATSGLGPEIKVTFKP